MSDMDMTIDCPKCGTPLRVPETAAGRRGRCTQCDRHFRIPSLDELLDATVSHFMLASIEAADQAEEAFEDALESLQQNSEEQQPDHAPPDDAGPSQGTVQGIPVVPSQHPDDTHAPVLSTDRLHPPAAAPDALHDHTDLIDITADIQQQDIEEDAHLPPPADPEPPDPRDESADAVDFADAEPQQYPSELRPTHARPYLVVRHVSIEGVRVAFDANWLNNEVFRTSMPIACAFTHEANPKTLVARAMIFLNKYQGPETPQHSLETRHELSVAANPSPRNMVRAIGRLEDFHEPFDYPILFYVSPGATGHTLEASAHTLSTGQTACEVLIPAHRTALQWLERVNGRCGPEYSLLKTEIVHYASDAWRQLPDQVRQRLSIWCRFEKGETFSVYLNDADFTHADAGLAGVVITDRRLIYHKYRRSRSVSLNQDALLHISTDSKIARLTLQSHGRAARCGKIHKANLAQLVDALSNASKLRVQVRKAQPTPT